MFEACTKIKKIMDKYGFSWFIVGGWAIDLFLKTETRSHDDIEIGIYRKDQMKLFRYFEKQKKYYIDNKSSTGKNEKVIWNKEYLRLPVHEIYIETKELEIEVLLNENDENNWIYRRNEKIKHDNKTAILFNENRIPFLCPEIVSLYKTINTREKDFIDIEKALTEMNEVQINWLLDSIKDKEIKKSIKNLTTALS